MSDRVTAGIDIGHSTTKIVVLKGGEIAYKAVDKSPAAGAEAFGCVTDKFNKVAFEAVTTAALRIEVQLQDKFSGGILEWRAGEK